MPPNSSTDDTLLPLRSITVEGFKSIDHEQTIELRPLTILAGTNSSGKSSMIQPLLLLKQTLEAPYDPGPLLLNGANAKFTLVDQSLNRSRVKRREKGFAFGFDFGPQEACKLHFWHQNGSPIDICKMSSRIGNLEVEVVPGETSVDESPLKILNLDQVRYYDTCRSSYTKVGRPFGSEFEGAECRG